MLGNGVEVDGAEVVDGGPQADGGHDRRRAGLELVGQIARLEAVEPHAADHAPSAQERRHRFQQFPLAVEHAHARRAEHLVAAEGQEVAIERLHVGLLMRHALRAVDQHHGPDLVGRGE